MQIDMHCVVRAGGNIVRCPGSDLTVSYSSWEKHFPEVNGYFFLAFLRIFVASVCRSTYCEGYTLRGEMFCLSLLECPLGILAYALYQEVTA